MRADPFGDAVSAPFRAIAFDAYGTLFDVHAIGVLGEGFWPGMGAALSALWREKQIDYSRLRTLSLHYADFWRVTGDALDYACERLSLDLTPERRDALMRGYSRLSAFPENRAALEALRAMGLRLAILSNGTPAMLADAVSAAGFDGLFEHVLSVESVGRFKTAPEAYQLGPDAFALPASEILFVSSNGWDACGAAWFGYKTFWINRAGAPPERLGVAPDAEGRTMRDVVSYCQAAR